MNLIGKIFVVLIFALSLLFMAFAVAVYGTHENWKVKAEAKQKEVDAARTQLQQEEEKRAALEAEIAKEAVAKRQALAKLETEKTELQTQRDEMSKQRDALVDKDKAAVAALDSAQQNLTKLTSEVTVLRTEIREAQTARDNSFNQVRDLTDQIHQAQGELKRLEERSVQLASQVTAQKAVLEAHNLTKDTPIDGLPPQVRGKVLAVNQKDMIEVSLGTDDGLREGHTLEIFRGSKYLGRIEVMHTSADRSVGKILPGFKKAPIQKDDDVATRFKVG